MEQQSAPIVEVFESIQGEGKTLGKPSIFVRFFGCNLRCQFGSTQCDTPYAVKTQDAKTQIWSVDKVVSEIQKYKATNIVWTGGEPLLYQDFICNVMNKLPLFYSAEVETNGTIKPSESLINVIQQFNLSVKLKGSNQEEGYDVKRINYKAIEEFPVDDSYFKFVVSNDEDIEEIIELTSKFPDLDVYLMPEGITRKDIIAHSQDVVDLCIEHGFNFCPREHIIIWDKLRGV